MERNEKLDWINANLQIEEKADGDFLDSLMEDLGYEPEDDDDNDEEAAAE